MISDLIAVHELCMILLRLAEAVCAALHLLLLILQPQAFHLDDKHRHILKLWDLIAYNCFSYSRDKSN